MPRLKTMSPGVFNPPVDSTVGQTMERTQQQLSFASSLKPPIASRPKKPSKPDWAEVVNRKRASAKKVVEKSATTTINKLAKEARVSKKMTKRTLTLIAMGDEPAVYQYQNSHPKELVDRIKSIMDDPDNKYYNSGTIKRLVAPNIVSKRFIQRTYRAKGFKYLRLRKTGKKKVIERYLHERIPSIYSLASQGFEAAEDECVYFLDECKFPLHSTGAYCWVKNSEDLVFNDREDNMIIHVIALCDRNGWIAFQICLEEVRSADFLYFVRTVLNRIASDKRVKIILDNGSWHCSKVIQNSDIFRFLAYNAPYFYEGNLIEMGFSAVKDTFRTRRVYHSLQDEIQCLIDNFLDPRHAGRFPGYGRMYLRYMLKVLNYREEKLN
jgi:transposase